MCGLVGCVGKVTKKEEDAFVTLLSLDTLRGPHSTGVAFIHHKDEPIIAKSEGTPWRLFGNDNFKKGMGRANAALIGHNRFATRGEINAKNAHPFAHENIIGAHNGTLRRQSLLLDYKDFEVDSDNLFYDMSKKGHKDTVSRLDGAFALSWYDAETGKINLCRNSERPLFFVFTKDNKTVFWASEAWMLSIALGRVSIEHHEIKELGVGEHVHFDVPDTYPSQTKAYDEYGSDKLALCPEYHYPEYNYQGYSRGNSEVKKEEKVGNQNATASKASGSGGSAIANLPADVTFPELLRKYRERGEIEFFIAEEVRKPTQAYGGNSSPYILGYTQDKFGVEVRIFQEPGSPIWKRLAQSQEWLRAKVRSTSQTGSNDGYITIDPRTLVDITWNELSNEGKSVHSGSGNDVTYKGFNGETLTANRYVELTNCGCALCNEIASTSESQQITWLNATDFLCKNCSKDGDFVRSLMEEHQQGSLIH